MSRLIKLLWNDLCTRADIQKAQALFATMIIISSIATNPNKWYNFLLLIGAFILCIFITGRSDK